MEDTGTHTLLRLLYRDASNYKQTAEVVLTGAPDSHSARRLRAALDQGTYLVAEQLA